jgi:hypothetical protein
MEVLYPETDPPKADFEKIEKDIAQGIDSERNS